MRGSVLNACRLLPAFNGCFYGRGDDNSFCDADSVARIQKEITAHTPTRSGYFLTIWGAAV